jgi:DNA-binding transcriptional ArsR family regulator
VSNSLERLLNHDFRLDLLCCLADEPLSVPALCARVSQPPSAVRYHLRLLEGLEVVGRLGDDNSATYAPTLDKHPPWVTEAIEGHKQDRPRLSATVRLMVGMKCDSCERLLEYRSPVVAVYRVGGSGSLRAKLVSEDTPGSGEAARLQATAKYHRDCYSEARNRDQTLPPID